MEIPEWTFFYFSPVHLELHEAVPDVGRGHLEHPAHHPDGAQEGDQHQPEPQHQVDLVDDDVEGEDAERADT